MAANLDDGEFWLPSRIFAEDELNVDNLDSFLPSALFSDEFYPGLSGVSSGLNSPVESQMRSGETESEEEDRLAELAWTMTHSILNVNVDTTGFAYDCDKYAGKLWSASPQTTICPFGSECWRSHGSPTCVCLNGQAYRALNVGGGNQTAPNWFVSEWPPLQLAQQKWERTGTGVFLPRIKMEIPAKPRRKPDGGTELNLWNNDDFPPLIRKNLLPQQKKHGLPQE